MFNYYSKSLLFVNRFKEMISNSMKPKPQIHVDAVLLIDIWGAESFISIISDGTDDIGGFTPNDWLNYQTTYQQRCHSFLQKFKFNTLINATYRGPSPTVSS